MPYIDVDILYAHIKQEDWLKEASQRVIARIEHRQLKAYTNLTSIIELQIISLRDYDRPFSLSIQKRLEQVHRLHMMPLTKEILSEADRLRNQYPHLAIFDSLHAANAILEDHKILSTDSVFDQVKELERTDPREG